MRIRSDPLVRRWVVWGTLALAFLLVNVHRLSTGVLAERLMRTFGTTGTALGTLHAAFFYVYAPLQVVAGVLADRVGIRRTATVGVAIMSAGALVFGGAAAYPMAFAGRVLVGLGASVIYIATLRFCANWFRPDEFATMNGLTIAVAGLGGILATTPLAVAVTALGLRATIQGLGAAGLALAGAVYLLARDTPAAAGMCVEGVPSAPPLALREVGANVRRVLGERETWLAGAVLFTATGVNVTVVGLWGVPYVVQTYGRSVTAASAYTLLGSAGLLLGPPAIGRLSDRLGRRTGLMVAGGVLYTAAFAVLAAGRPPLPVVGGAFFLTGALAGAFVLGYTVVKERHGSAASGVATGTVNAMAFAGAAVFPTVMGGVLDAYWTGETVAGARAYTPVGYRVTFGVAALAGALALGCSLWLHLRERAREGGEPAQASA